MTTGLIINPFEHNQNFGYCTFGTVKTIAHIPTGYLNVTILTRCFKTSTKNKNDKQFYNWKAKNNNNYIQPLTEYIRANANEELVNDNILFEIKNGKDGICAPTQNKEISRSSKLTILDSIDKTLSIKETYNRTRGTYAHPALVIKLFEWLDKKILGKHAIILLNFYKQHAFEEKVLNNELTLDQTVATRKALATECEQINISKKSKRGRSTTRSEPPTNLTRSISRRQVHTNSINSGLYLIKIFIKDENGNELYKCGRTESFTTRFEEHKKTYDNIEVLYTCPTHSTYKAEVKMLETLNRCGLLKDEPQDINGVNKRELITLTNEKTIDDVKQIMDESIEYAHKLVDNKLDIEKEKTSQKNIDLDIEKEKTKQEEVKANAACIIEQEKTKQQLTEKILTDPDNKDIYLSLLKKYI